MQDIRLTSFISEKSAELINCIKVDFGLFCLFTNINIGYMMSCYRILRIKSCRRCFQVFYGLLVLLCMNYTAKDCFYIMFCIV